MLFSTATCVVLNSNFTDYLVYILMKSLYLTFCVKCIIQCWKSLAVLTISALLWFSDFFIYSFFFPTSLSLLLLGNIQKYILGPLWSPLFSDKTLIFNSSQPGANALTWLSTFISVVKWIYKISNFFWQTCHDTVHLDSNYSDILTHLFGILAWLMCEDGIYIKIIIFFLLFNLFWNNFTNLNSCSPSSCSILLGFYFICILFLPSFALPLSFPSNSFIQLILSAAFFNHFLFSVTHRHIPTCLCMQPKSQQLITDTIFHLIIWYTSYYVCIFICSYNMLGCQEVDSLYNIV